ncbi:MAG: SMC-Scp complex subunit ScpB [Candidatus Omnitrophica bacterium CG1_02_49_16]|nr:MAG: SMC-Scp complex subunit ScpB [Candidatus Omnitrophica bacterium CG1_02_49_16]
MPTDDLKNVIEAFLFATERPLTIEDIKEGFSASATKPADPSSGGEGGSASDGEDRVTAKDILEILNQLKVDYENQNRGFRLTEMAGGYQLVTDSRLAPYLKRFYQERETKKLSKAGLETLSVIAYRQPVTRADIEGIRGVNVDGAIRALLEKGLVKIVGRKEVPGRPMLYGTTKAFLDHFALRSVKDLPALNTYTLKDIEPSLLPPELRNHESTAPEDGKETAAIDSEQPEEKTPTAGDVK